MKISQGMLVMAMDGGKMVLLRNDGDAISPRLETVLEEEDRNPKSALQGSDRPGRSFSSSSPRRSAYSDTDWHDDAESAFVMHAIDKLEGACRDNDAKVIVFAAPAAMGDFRKHRGAAISERIAAEISKDLVNSTPAEIAEAIIAYEP